MNKSYKLAVITSVALAASLGMTDAHAGLKISKGFKIKITCGDCRKVDWAVDKALKDFDREILRPAGDGLGELGQAILDGTERLANDINQSIDAMGPCLAKGDIIGGIYEGQKALTNRASDSMAQTMSESSWLRGATTLALSTINPAAGAGFQAWYVREMTGSDSLGLKAFATSWATSAALGHIAGAPATSASLSEKALASGMVSGLATAAHGGHFEHGFVLGATASALTTWHQQDTGMQPFAETASGEPLIKRTDAQGNPLYGTDYVTGNPLRPHTGVSSAGLSADPTLLERLVYYTVSEHSPVMQGLAKGVPGIQGGSMWHDVVVHTAPTWVSATTAVPWMALQYHALGGALQDELTRNALRSRSRVSPLRESQVNTDG
jgi:hypothetical protein